MRSLPGDDRAVPDWWRSLGLPGLIDIHTHFMPDRLMARVWEYFDAAGPLIRRRWPIRYRLPEADRVELLRAMGVRAFTSLLYPHKKDMAAALNEWASGFAGEIPECLETATFYPEPSAIDYVRLALDRGVQIFKVHLQVGGFDPRTAVLDPIWGMIAEAGVPLIVHAGSGPVATDHTGPEPFGEVLARYPRLRAIIAHLGAPEFEGFFKLADRYNRVCLDTTMAFTESLFARSSFPGHLYPELRDLGLDGRVLLGTDFPNIPYAYAHQLEVLDRLDLGDVWLRAVCWHNAARMFEIAGSP